MLDHRNWRRILPVIILVASAIIVVGATALQFRMNAAADLAGGIRRATSSSEVSRQPPMSAIEMCYAFWTDVFRGCTEMVKTNLGECLRDARGDPSAIADCEKLLRIGLNDCLEQLQQGYDACTKLN